MKKLLLAGALALFCSVSAQRVQQGDQQLNAGIGLTNGWGTPVYVGYDYGITNDITLGFQGTYASKNYSAPGFSDYKGTWFGLGANANYHFNNVLKIPNNWDLYAGATLAYNSFSYKYPAGYTGNNTGSGVGFAGQLGARYYFSDNFGLNLEFGGGNIASGGKFGISYKF